MLRMIFKRSSEINTSRRDLLWPDERTDRFRYSSDVSGAEEREKIDHLLRRRSLPSEGGNLTILVHDVVDIDEYLFFRVRLNFRFSINNLAIFMTLPGDRELEIRFSFSRMN